ncbi:MAG: cysteine desulfurase-like protein [Actinomycetes bacterium]
MTLDLDALRRHFPSLQSGLAHFDGPGGTQTPREVGEVVAATLTGPLSNRGTAAVSERNAEDAVAAFRSAYADLLGASPQGIVYGRSATQMTYDFSRHLAKSWQPGDEVVVSRLDHDANVSPWLQAAEAVGARVRWIDFDPESSEIEWASVEQAIRDRTRVVALTAASNLLGTKPPVRQVADIAHAVGALLYVDGVHYTAHEFVDLDGLGADFFVCSPYKFLGPHCAVLAASPELLESITPDKLAPSTNDVPERFELGTLPYEIMAGATAAVDFLADVDPGVAVDRRERLRASLQAIGDHELRLREAVEAGLRELGDRVVLHSRALDRTPTLLLTLPGRRSVDACRFLAKRKVLAPAGFFYAHQATMRMGLDDTHALRVGIAPYNTEDDVARLVSGLTDFLSTTELLMSTT